MRAATAFAACLLLLLTVPQGLAQEDRRQDLFQRINAERQRAGAPPLRLSAALNRAAEEHAAEVARRGSLTTDNEAMHARLKRAGYEAHSWTERLAASFGGPENVLRQWRLDDPRTFRELLASEVRDLGIGLDRMDGMPLYIFLFAVPEADHFARGTAGIRDLERVRAEVLARVNAARKKTGAPPLRSSTHLDQAAQLHSEDMLARRYFAHRDPQGRTVRERALAAGYDWRTIGENVAENQFSVDEVMDGWLRSPGHRRNILNPTFRELGVGLALGPSGGKNRVTWTQVFGTR
jgi:uncharacterized protein YkwD